MRQGLGPTAWLLLCVAGAGALPAAAQVLGGVSGTGSTPDSLPSLPDSGYGVGGALSPGNTPNPDLIQAPQAPSARLGAPGAGIAPLQQGDPRAPAFLILPRVAVSETLTDNARQTPTNRTADFDTQIAPGLSISADTPRLRGVLNATLAYDKFVFATDQDRRSVTLYGSGLVTAIPDMMFVDLKSSISQASQTGAAGFSSVAQLPKSTLTPVITSSVSPYLRQSYYGLVESELRYRFATTSSGGGVLGGTLTTSPTLQTAQPLSDTTVNQGTLTVATGRDFERLLSRLTIDASKTESSSVAANSRVTGYDDLEYRFAPGMAAIGRLGYENIHYASAPAATTVGVAWQIGGRLNFGADTDYVIARYGKQEGIYGFSGAAHYQITPATVLTAAAGQGLGSQQDQAANTLTQSSLDPYGRIVDQYNLPTAFVNPNFAIQNDVFRSKNYRVDVTTAIGANRFSLFGTYDRRESVATSAPPSTSVGAHFSWSRDIRPNLTGTLTTGFSNVSNLTVTTAPNNPSNPSTSTLIRSTNTMTANLSLNYLFNETLTGSVAYNLIYQTGGPSISNTNVVTVGDILTNRLIFALNKTF